MCVDLLSPYLSFWSTKNQPTQVYCTITTFYSSQQYICTIVIYQRVTAWDLWREEYIFLHCNLFGRRRAIVRETTVFLHKQTISGTSQIRQYTSTSISMTKCGGSNDANRDLNVYLECTLLPRSPTFVEYSFFTSSEMRVVCATLPFNFYLFYLALFNSRSPCLRTSIMSSW